MQLDGGFGDPLHAPLFRRGRAAEIAAAARAEARAIRAQVERVLDRLAETENGAVIRACESRIEKPERQERILEERAVLNGKGGATFEESFELAMRFLASLWRLWASGRLDLRRLVLRLAFTEPLTYCRKEGVRTPKSTLPFRRLGGFLRQTAEWWSQGGSNP